MKVLVVSAHADDESLGAGGTLLKFKNLGGQIHWLNFTDMRKEYGYTAKETKKRQSEILAVKKEYGFNSFTNFCLKPSGLDQYPKESLIRQASAVIAKIKPDTLILPFCEDPHSDHRVVFNTLFPCSKIFRAVFIKKILMMEIVSETDFAPSLKGFSPNYFVDVTDFLERKLKITGLYSTEISKHPFPRSLESIKSLAVTRGAAAGCRYAEAFMLIKAID